MREEGDAFQAEATRKGAGAGRGPRGNDEPEEEQKPRAGVREESPARAGPLHHGAGIPDGSVPRVHWPGRPQTSPVVLTWGEGLMASRGYQSGMRCPGQKPGHKELPGCGVSCAASGAQGQGPGGHGRFLAREGRGRKTVYQEDVAPLPRGGQGSGEGGGW